MRALRDDDGPNGAGERVEPPTGLAAVEAEALAARQRSAGLAIDIREHGSRTLSPGLDQAAYRILQEALTNAARHGAGSAVVEIGFRPTSLELTVTNPTGPASAGAEGHGIVGMRERAALLGGSLEAGASDGRFRVRASLPYDSEGA